MNGVEAAGRERESALAMFEMSGHFDRMLPLPSRPVLLYDGECGLCNAIVRFMLKHDRRGALRFAPLQGAAAQAFLRSRGMDTRDFDSIVFIEDIGRSDTRHFTRTTGALGAMHEMGGRWTQVAGVLRVVPACVRDVIYKLVARIRYRIFGRYKPTPLPDPRWAERFID